MFYIVQNLITKIAWVDKCDQNTVLDKSRKQYMWRMRGIRTAFIPDSKSFGVKGVGHHKVDLLHFRKLNITPVGCV